MVPDRPLDAALSSPERLINEVFQSEASASTSALARALSTRYSTLLPDAASRARVKALDEVLAGSDGSAASTETVTPAALRGQVVRWRCMVQDTGCGAEVLPKSIKLADGSKRCALWVAEAASPAPTAEDEQPDDQDLTERQVVYAVSLPGWSDWAKAAWDSGSDPADEVLSTLQGLSLSEQSTSPASAVSSPAAQPKSAYSNKHPTPEAAHSIGALLKIYDDELAETLRVTQVVDVLGVLDESSMPGADWATLGSNDAAPPSVPALHVLHLEPVTATTELPQPLEEAERSALLTYIASALGGDEHAAEWTLLALLARIHSRRGALVLGSLSLNLSGATAPELQRTLSTLLPATVAQSLDLAHLNATTTRIAPRSEGGGTGLLAGRMQLPSGTCVICDEGVMGEGTLGERGVQNVRQLASLLSTHKLAYSFPFSNFEFDTDLPFIVFSSGKSFLPVDVHVPLQPNTSSSSVSPTNAQFSTWRTFLARARFVELEIPTDVAEAIQSEFVKARREGQDGVREGQEDLLRRMAVARLLALSKGLGKLDMPTWYAAVQLDEKRRLRVVASTPSKSGAARA